MKAFEEFVTRGMKADKIPGLTLGFTLGDQTWIKGFGYADVENKVAAEAGSAYRLASVTKTMTGVAILQLVASGQMKLDEEIQTYLPSYPKQKWPVTVRQLLVHTGGGQTGSGIGPEYVTPKEVVERIAKYPVQIEPGTKFDYQTSGYNLLGAAIEEITKSSLNDYFKEHLFLPAGIRDVQMDNVRAIIPHRVRGYEMVNNEVKNAPFLDVSSRFGGGGLIGTVPGMLKWINSIESGKLLPKQYTDTLFTPVTLRNGYSVMLPGNSWYYTLGWIVFPLNGRFVYYNDGGQTGTNTMVLRVPSLDLSIAFACNLQNIDRMVYVKRLYQVLTGEVWDVPAYTEAPEKQAVLKSMENIFNYGGLYFDRKKKGLSSDLNEITKSAAYFENIITKAGHSVGTQEIKQLAEDGKHAVGGNAFLILGSYMFEQLCKNYGQSKLRDYSRNGAIVLFNDYIKLYRSLPADPKKIVFRKEVESLVEHWYKEWSRSWIAGRASDVFMTDSSEVLNKLLGFSVAGEMQPDYIAHLIAVRNAYAKSRDWKKAAAVTSLLPRLYPNSDVANFYYALGAVLIGKNDTVEKALKKAISINPNGIANWRTLIQVANGLGEIDKIREAIDWMNIAVGLYPKEPTVYVRLGELYEAVKSKDAAIRFYKEALRLDPNLEKIKERIGNPEK